MRLFVYIANEKMGIPIGMPLMDLLRHVNRKLEEDNYLVGVALRKCGEVDGERLRAALVIGKIHYKSG